MTEKLMWQKVRGGWAEFDPKRIENQLERGTPDVNLTTGWVEFKCLDYFGPAGANIKLHHFTPEQRLWLETRWRKGKNCWLLLWIQRTDEWFLFDGQTASTFLGHVTEKALRRLAACITGSGDDPVMRNWLSNDLARLSAGEQSKMLRLRAMKTLEEIASLTKQTNQAVLDMENGKISAEVLIEFWRAKSANK